MITMLQSAELGNHSRQTKSPAFEKTGLSFKEAIAAPSKYLPD
jgi:hypothetical protein